MKKYFVVTSEDNYADEFDTQIMFLKAEKQLKGMWHELALEYCSVFDENYDVEEKLSFDKEISVGFGSNESLQFNNFSALVDSIKLTRVSKKTYKEMKPIVGVYGFGLGIDLS